MSLSADQSDISLGTAGFHTPRKPLLLDMDDITDHIDGYVARGENMSAIYCDRARLGTAAPRWGATAMRASAARPAGAFVRSVHSIRSATEMKSRRRLRDASPTATPTRACVRIADQMLGRNGRMVTAVESIGTGRAAMRASRSGVDLE